MITELSKDKFEITVNADQLTKHVVSVTDQMLLNLTKNKISKEELLNFSFNFLLEREPNTSILSKFDKVGGYNYSDLPFYKIPYFWSKFKKR